MLPFVGVLMTTHLSFGTELNTELSLGPMSLSAGQKCILVTFLLAVGYDSSLAKTA